MDEPSNPAVTTDDQHLMTAGGLTATVRAKGAELCSLTRPATVPPGAEPASHELIWPAGPRWPSHGPLLFPIVGELRGHTLDVDGQVYPMERHGFARRTVFGWTHRSVNGCTLAIDDTPATHSHYPFAFRLEAAYALAPDGLTVTLTAINTGDAVLPCSLGFHPAFKWPLDGGAKEDHRIELSANEAPTIGQLNADGLIARQIPSPLQDRVLHLSEELFAHDALVFQPLRSIEAHYYGPQGRGLHLSWRNATHLGIWSKPGDFVCIEPWHGVASPAGFTGDFTEKPGLLHLPPGDHASLSMTIRPT